jgi:hypothetical protein
VEKLQRVVAKFQTLPAVKVSDLNGRDHHSKAIFKNIYVQMGSIVLRQSRLYGAWLAVGLFARGGPLKLPAHHFPQGRSAAP